MYEERNITTFEIPGAYLHADMPADKNMILKLCGHFVDIMCNITKNTDNMWDISRFKKYYTWEW